MGALLRAARACTHHASGAVRTTSPGTRAPLPRRRSRCDAHRMSTPKVSRAHRGGVYALVVAATVTAFLAVFAICVQRQVLDGDNWTTSSSRLLEDPTIRTAVAGYLSPPPTPRAPP